MKEARAYCPASISLIFKVHSHDDPVRMGSTGVSFTIDRGVTAHVRSSSQTTLLFNGQSIKLPTVSWIVKELIEDLVEINLETFLPLGCGFGISGAAALAASLALNKFFNLKKERDELLKLAHISEVKHRTGLGDIATQSVGGFLVRRVPGISCDPLRLPFVGQVIYAAVLGTIKTSSVLRDYKKLEHINRKAQRALNDIARNSGITLEEIFDRSYEFAKKSRLMENTAAASLIEEMRKDGGHATMAMLGQVVLSTNKSHIATGYKVRKLKISEDSARLLRP